MKKTINVRKILEFLPLPVIIFVLVFVIVPKIAVAGTWTDQTTFGSGWTGLSLSSDGTILIGAQGAASSSLYKFTYSGVSWATSTLSGAGLKQWKYVACSSDCTYIIASEQSGDLWFSNDHGVTWSDQSNAGSRSWTGVAINASGTELAAVANPGGFWISTSTSMSSGGNWSNPTFMNSGTPNTLTMSSDGSKMAIGQFGGDIYTGISPFLNANWTDQTGSGSHFWNSVAMSGNGNFLVGAVAFAGDIYTATGTFANWTDQTGAGTGGGGQWKSVAISDDGSHLMAVANGGTVRSATTTTSLSTWNPSSWTTESSPGTASWNKVTMSSDGLTVAIGGTGTDIWTLTPVLLPTVITATTTSITITSATLNGNITNTGGENNTVEGFNYGTSTSYGSATSSSGSFGSGAYSLNVSSLTCNTTYHFQAFSTNSTGTATSTDDSFTTSACPVAPTVTTGTSTNVTASIATLGGNITATGGTNETSRYIKYSTDLSYSLQSANDTGSFGTGAFTENISGLSAGTTYNYEACAVSSGGTGCGSNQTFTTLDVPGAPTSLSGTAGYTQASLSWMAPSSTGGSDITDYLIEYKTTTGSIWSTFSHTATTSTSAIVTGLVNGVSYDFRVSAINSAGIGTFGGTVTLTPTSTPTTPNAPTGVTGTSSSGQVDLSWTAPVNNGGAAISDYKIEYKTLTASSWSTFSHTATTSTSTTVTGLTNGTAYDFRVSAVNSVGSGTASDIFVAGAGQVYLHILSTGQSLSEGVNSLGALSTSQPYNNLSLSNSPDGGLNTPLIPLVETVNGRESPASGLANSLRVTDTQARPEIVSIHGQGGQPYSSIKKGGTGTAYANGQTQASTAKSAVEALGGFYQPLAVTIVHGETDAINGINDTTYAGYMQQLQSDYQSDWNALTGLSGTIPMFESQMSTNSEGYVAVGQLEAHKNNPGKIILIGPKYQLPYYTDDLHLINTSSKYLGELFAKVMKKVLFDGQTWDPLMPTQVTRSGNIVTIDYHIPYGNLAIDTTNVAARTNYGFEFTQTGGATTTISSVALVNNNTQVQITLSGTPTGTNQHIRYAWTCELHPNDSLYGTCGDPTNSSAVGGNIRDTDSSVSTAASSTGLALYDWGVTFDEPISDPTVPEAPTVLSGTSGNGQVSLSWTAPELNGGATTTDYLIEYKTRAASTWSTFSHAASTSTSATVTGLTNGTNYVFRVSAVNSIGSGSASNNIVVTPATTPNAPTSLSAVGGSNAQVSLSWTAPASNGGSDVYDYLVEYKQSSTSTWSTFSDGISATTSTTVTGLTNGVSYDFRVSSINFIGTSSASSIATATPDITVPDAPTSLSATAGDAQVSLSWSAPSNDGGSSIINYLIEYKKSSDSVWSTFANGTTTTPSATVTGLTNSISYDFRVSAISSIGTGSASSITVSTPVATVVSTTITNNIHRGRAYIPQSTTTQKTTQLVLNTFVSPFDNSTKECPAFVKNMKPNSRLNDINQVKLWQAFLDIYNKEHLPLTGYFGPLTTAATKRFQSDYYKEILLPVGLSRATGYAYSSSRAQANKMLGCVSN